MRTVISILGIFLVFCATATGFATSPAKNVLLICVDDLRPELNCYGASYVHSPNIDALASRGIRFERHYVQAPTCGASRYTLLTGRYGGSNNSALFNRADQLRKKPESVPPSMPAWFKQHGFTTVSVGKVSHHPGGRGGNRWNDSDKSEMPNSWDRHLLPAGDWQDPRGWMHGLAHGEIRDDRRTPKGTIEMDVMQSLEGPDSIYPDGVSIDEAIRQMDLLSQSDQPFFLAVGILRPHLPFGAPAKYIEPYLEAELPPTPHPEKPSGKTTWHSSGEFMKYDRQGKDPNKDAAFAIEVRKHYAACVSYADAQVGKLLQRLRENGNEEDTVVVLWGDHGWHLGEHAIWGKHALFEESLRSPLIISYPNMEQRGQSTSAVVETLDLFPTLCQLTGLPMPEFAQGDSLAPVLQQPTLTKDGSAFSYKGNAQTIRTPTHRLILHKDGFTELYDHTSQAGESENIASSSPEIVKQLSGQIHERLGK